MRRSSISISLLALILLGSAIYFFRPSLIQRPLVEDGANLLTEAQIEHISEYHDFLLKDHGIDYRIVSRASGEDINLFAVNYFETNGVGQRSQSGHGLLLVVDTKSDQVRLEVSQSLEAVYLDAFIAYIEQRQMVPFFAQGRLSDGILATTEMIITRAQNAKQNAGFTNEPWPAQSSGAGATTQARLTKGRDNDFKHGDNPSAGETPDSTLARYRETMSRRNLRTDLVIYSTETKKMLEDWVMTPAQADNQARSLDRCRPKRTAISADGQLAVINYAIEDRQCNPWFFVHEQGGWRLDLTMLQKAIRFGRSNAWHFANNVDHPYQFAFENWRLDKNGYPVK